MYLKRLELLGFKSFADKIKLEFLPGVTGVVGPNGSGKSNISDALRWVLGEQSIKTLRGSKMDDVIFAGTQVRKPLGLAEVTIVLDNSDHSIPLDFNEVSVTRKLFRSGESEYLINKSQVRLKDVYELFYDTGLGKDAYSVIGQGKIDNILSAKAEERRSIFEEAAGIIKYKGRKQIAERKLEDTQKHLVRVWDIINELNAQLEPLEIQSNLAERFLKLKASLSELEINHYGKIIRALQEELKGLEQNQVETQQQFHDFEAEEALIDSEQERVRLELLKLDNVITALNENFFRIQNQIDKYVEQVNFLNNKSEDLEGQVASQRAGLMNNLGRKTALVSESQRLDEELAQLVKKVNEARELLGIKETQLVSYNEGLNELEIQEQKLKDQLIEVLNDLSDFKNKQSSTAVQKDFLERQLEDCHNKQGVLSQQHQQLLEQLTKEKAELQDYSGQLSQLGATRQAGKKQLGQLNQQIVDQEGENQEYQRKIRAIEGKLSLLEEMEKSFQGYFRGVKSLLADAAEEKFQAKIRGVVADLIKVESGMELALETAFGSALQYIVIEDDQGAQDGIAFLKRHGKGRATFLPLNRVRAAAERDHSDLLKQFNCHNALSLLKFNPEYQQVIAYLLHQVVVAPDLKTASAISAKLERGYRVVTPEGDLVNAGGSITGGSVDRQRLGLLSRKREIEDFQAEQRRFEVALQQGIIKLKSGQKLLEDQQRQLDKLLTQEQEMTLKRVSREGEINTLQENIKRIAVELQLLEGQLAELDLDLKEFDNGREELVVAIAGKEQQLQEVEIAQAKLAESIKGAQQEKEEQLQELSELRSLLSAAQQEQNGKQVLKGNFDKQLAELQEADGAIEAKIAELLANQTSLQDNGIELEQQIIAARVQLAKEQEQLGTERTSKEELQSKLKELEGKQRSFRRKTNDFQNKIHQLELSITNKINEIENLQRSLVETYGLDWEQQLNPDWESPVQVDEEISHLKEELRELGPVNVGAIEEYEQVKQRSDFLNNQSADLEQAKASLNKVIAEIERTIEKRFNETFQQIRVEFKKLFGELFQGGSADLFLIEPELPLESGIEIVAQPPGKKPQSLSLLSGGERAMTAIALLFAILSIKPAPFCVLDEIDATLDEANVQRFAKLLKIFSDKLQFIVVTHRRGTMEVANALYGVTMEEMGISKLVSLDLSNKVS